MAGSVGSAAVARKIQAGTSASLGSPFPWIDSPSKLLSPLTRFSVLRETETTGLRLRLPPFTAFAVLFAAIAASAGSPQRKLGVTVNRKH